ncbi:unnamed protein product [Brachionus calyciflorus]|uniref:Reverse transcriptase domain-containing protein n=1 Tax=Brachionus calyciflorus TaxID=104777 RepID=A0A813MIQ0_9BILA|nr:unnamed protein product [Brachionus calyciflorus]
MESLDYLNKLSKFSLSDFNIMHLNINSVNNKCFEVQQILKHSNFDILFFSETRLNSNKPVKQLKNCNYKEILYYRPNNSNKTSNEIGGGLLLYIKNGIKIVKQKVSSNLFEYIFIQIDVKNQLINFIISYKAPNMNNNEYLEQLDNLIFSLDPNIPLFVVGDLNIDSLNDLESNYNEFLNSNSLINFITTPTRIKTKFYKDSKEFRTKCSNLDVILHNGDLIKETMTIDCPFSDHFFTTAKLHINSFKKEPKEIYGRNLSAKNINLIVDEIAKINFFCIAQIESVDQSWLAFKTKIQTIIDRYSPIQKITLKDNDLFPWFDDELLYIKHCRDTAYKSYVLDKLNGLKYGLFYYWKNQFTKQYESKMINYFKMKTMTDFKNSKKFWEFYSSHIKIKSDKSNKPNSPAELFFKDQKANSIEEISEMFNLFFTSIKSDSKIEYEDCELFCDNFFDKLISDGSIKPNKFKFEPTNEAEICELISSLSDSSGPGFDGIPTKILKLISPFISKFLCTIFNRAIAEGKIPNDFKVAVVTPLFKNKGTLDDINNYRGISVLSPLSKVFEKIIYKQIYNYFDINKLMNDNQHGFRNSRSCETALHTIISQMFKTLSQRLIALFIFIDFKKAFDTVDSRILIIKLRKYGFDPGAIKLIVNYFLNRQQKVKFESYTSSFANIKFGVPQGSVLGPLLFLIFINDIVSYLINFEVKLFADDTTLSLKGNNLTELLEKFNSSIMHLTKCRNFNRIDINWSKTKIMFISKKRNIILPSSILIDKTNVEVVDSFKLLGKNNQQPFARNN